MPAYQLAAQIVESIEAVSRAVADLDAEIIVVDDGSDDGTGANAQRAADRIKSVEVVHHSVNKGKGEALVTGWRHARGDLICFIDADLDLPPDQIPAMVAQLDGADAVVGAKRSTMTEDDYPPVRRVLSRIFAFLTTGLLGLPIRETQTGLKVFRQALLREVLPHVRIRGYAFDLELILRAHRAGYRVLETPVRLGPGAAGASLRPKMLWELGRDTLRLMWWTILRR
jgi:glycosyltransferase involved in cell wall biosynthesis